MTVLVLGGLLAAAIHNMNGVGDLSGWRWIFIIEGLLTIVIAIVSYWVIQDFPETAKFISEEESEYYFAKSHKRAVDRILGVFVIRRLQEDMRMSAAGEKYNKKYIWQSLSDWKTWVASKSIFFQGSLVAGLTSISGYIYGLVRQPQNFLKREPDRGVLVTGHSMPFPYSYLPS